MNSKCKPYRLINCTELSALKQDFEHALQAWNKVHALFPLSCHLSRNPKRPNSRELDDMDKSRLSLIKYSLFGDKSDCFDTVANALFSSLLEQLSGSSTCMLNRDSTHTMTDWFYTGAPTLGLMLTCAGETTTLFMDPQWVLDALPATDCSKKSIIPLDDALATQALDLHVTLNPLPLKLADILRLQVGDLIKTDHPIAEPMTLTYQQQTICNVNIGKSNVNKSILTTRTS